MDQLSLVVTACECRLYLLWNFIDENVLVYLVLAVIVSIHANPVLRNGLPSRYHVSGVIQLPYAEISEPFESWIDVDAGFSRIDYYGGEWHYSDPTRITIESRF